ncbi:hypothetical protein BHE74_00039555 [Ensete ventricosum]|nr:hypothetical protein GW17_00019657 [Ensete ventricosum]RWW53902.1 hypothetical protein BHE74_00039555 [Ensete ventricosum]RZS08272.1 hypothetical protein BHM03_00039211 [Ensete ventricosum]
MKDSEEERQGGSKSFLRKKRRSVTSEEWSLVKATQEEAAVTSGESRFRQGRGALGVFYDSEGRAKARKQGLWPRLWPARAPISYERGKSALRSKLPLKQRKQRMSEAAVELESSDGCRIFCGWEGPHHVFRR